MASATVDGNAASGGPAKVPVTNTDGNKSLAQGVTILNAAGEIIDPTPTGTNYTEDAAAASNPVGGALILVRRDTLTAAEVTTDGDNVALKGTSRGQAHVHDLDANTALTAANASLDAIEAKQIAGPSTAATSQSVVPSTDQNPIFDHTNGTKTAVTASATIITTGAGHTFLRITTDIDIVVNTAGATAVDDGTSARIVANVPEVIPVPPSTAIKALSLGASATVRCTPLKVR